MSINIPGEVVAALDRLTGSGYEAYVVGGCVRDSLMGILPKDWDVCTLARPDEVMDCFKGFRIVETGLKYGTLTVMMPSDGQDVFTPVEITTFRVDGSYRDHRRPDEVEFTSHITDDLSRRDFTMNAIAYHPDTGLVDPFGGSWDIGNGLIRCVKDPKKRFAEDALRIMRLLRFASVTGFTMEESTFAAAKQSSFLLAEISAERIFSELKKLVCAAHCGRVLDEGKDIIAVFMPEIIPMFGFAQNNPHHVFDVWQHTIHSVQSIRADAILRLTMLFHDIAKPHTYSCDKRGIGHFYGHPIKSADMAADILKRLKADGQICRTVDTLIRNHCITLSASPKNAGKWLRILGEDNLRRLLEVKRADTIAKGIRRETNSDLYYIDRYESLIDDVIASESCFRLKDLAVNGDDLIAAGITDGKTIGRLLDNILTGVINGDLQNERAEILKHLDALNES